ncbi:MAG TPA: DUF2950 domain-containing protein [Steroidobacteraceae bacterium]|nr:DUF2950 domain-containing protein [Steroidobacteraceae bacterium]
MNIQFTSRALIAAALVALAGCAQHTASTPTPASFKSPDEAVAALIAASRAGDLVALQKLLGPGTADLLSSGDAVADKRERDAFVQRYDAQHELVAGSPDDLVLLVGEDRWPVPIPLLRTGNSWSFDGAAGAGEIVLRRIGANELHTIDVMNGFVAAQEDYASSGHDGSKPGAYAQKLHSTPGKHDGLYWEEAPGESPSPAGPMLAAASSEGYARAESATAPAGASHGVSAPYHGYIYRLLLSQGPEANGGARDYIVKGRQIGGFAAIAYPAQYAVSGVMSFIVNQDGVIWQRDLGKDTAQAAAAIQQFNPDDNWTPIAPEG